LLLITLPVFYGGRRDLIAQEIRMNALQKREREREK
jgi:hypothetical protein